jgi:hypothetical protein
MRSALRVLSVATVLAASLACSGGDKTASCPPAVAPEPFVGTPLATVDGQKVGSVAWEQLAARKPPANGETWSPEEKRKILDEAIDEEVLFREAFDRGLYQDPKVRKILVNLLLRSEIFEKVKNEDFTDADLKAYFDAHQDEFVVPEKVQLKRIFVAAGDQRSDAEAKKLADELYAKVKANPDGFRDVAMASSEDPFARRGGDLGYVDATGKAGIPPEVVSKGFSLQTGEISEPFEAAGGYNIVYVPTKRERIERTFEQMRGAVLRRLKNEKYEQLTQDFLASLKKEASISVDQAALDAWNPTPPSRPGLRLNGPEAALGEGNAPPLAVPPPGGAPDPAEPPTPDAE